RSPSTFGNFLIFCINRLQLAEQTVGRDSGAGQTTLRHGSITIWNAMMYKAGDAFAITPEFEPLMITNSSRLPPLHSLTYFEAVGRLMSFTKAAEELCVTQSA